jgi:hypothetical protein
MPPGFKKFSFGRVSAFALAILCMVGLTNHWLVKETDMSIFQFDSVSYLEIARHAPKLPGFIDVSAGYPERPDREAVEIPYQHSQRFAFPFALGALAKIASVPVENLFAVTSVLVFAASLLLLQLNWWRRLGSSTSLLLLGLFVLNPFIVRFYFSVPTYLGDIVFHLSLAILCLGLLRHSPPMVLLAMIMGILGRQTMLLALPAIWIWPWKTPNHRIWVALATLICLALYVFTGRVAAEISPTNRNLEHLTGMIAWLTGSGMEGHSREGQTLLQSASVLARFFLRALLAQLPLFAMLVCLVKFKRISFFFRNREALALFLMAAGIASQPFLAGPTLTGDTVVRLVALSSVPLLVLSSMLISKEAIGFGRVVVGLLLLFLSSLHHRYSILSAMPGREYIFIFLQLAATGYLAYLICSSERNSHYEIS